MDRKPHKIKAVLTNAGIRKEFLGNVSDDEKKAVKAFTGLATNKATALKRNPKVSSVAPLLAPWEHLSDAAATIKTSSSADACHDGLK